LATVPLAMSCWAAARALLLEIAKLTPMLPERSSSTP
jgi:hypothetical protein